MSKAIDLTGQRFGRLVVIENAGNYAWVCGCDCGRASVVQAGKLRSGHTKSCGCLKRESSRLRATKHAMSHTPEYRAWAAMLTRCYNPTYAGYPYYGGRGIRVCDEWRHDFATWYAYMGARPSPNHSNDRIDPNGNYEPGGVRWATKHEQRINRRQIKKLALAA